jgi:hypothetical protein
MKTGPIKNGMGGKEPVCDSLIKGMLMKTSKNPNQNTGKTRL